MNPQTHERELGKKNGSNFVRTQVARSHEKLVLHVELVGHNNSHVRGKAPEESSSTWERTFSRTVTAFHPIAAGRAHKENAITFPIG